MAYPPDEFFPAKGRRDGRHSDTRPDLVDRRDRFGGMPCLGCRFGKIQDYLSQTEKFPMGTRNGVVTAGIGVKKFALEVPGPGCLSGGFVQTRLRLSHIGCDHTRAVTDGSRIILMRFWRLRKIPECFPFGTVVINGCVRAWIPVGIGLLRIV